MNTRGALSSSATARVTAASSRLSRAACRLAAWSASAAVKVAKVEPGSARAPAKLSTGSWANLSAADSAARNSP